MKSLSILITAFLLFGVSQAIGQTTIQAFDFNSGLGSWSVTGPEIIASTANPSTGYTGASGSGNVLFSNGTTATNVFESPNVSTVGFTNIILSYGEIADIDFPTFLLNLEYSTDGGSSYNPLPNTPNGPLTWDRNTGTALPASANGITNFRIRISFESDGGGGEFRFDDVEVLGTAALITTYYSKSTGFLNNLATWGSNTDGSGSAPANFVLAGVTFVVRNNATPTLNGSWTVSGTGSKIQIEGSSNFTVPLGSPLTATVDILNNGILTLIDTITSGITIGSLDVDSRVFYSGSASQVIRPGTYGRLTNSTANHNLAGDVIVNNFLTTSTSGTRIGLQSFKLTINGQVSDNLFLNGSTTAQLEINGTAPFIGSLTVNGSNLSTLTLNRNVNLVLAFTLTINSSLNLQQGAFVINSRTLNIGPSASMTFGTGRLSSNGTATVNINSGAIPAGQLVFDPGADSLSALTINKSASLGGTLKVRTLTINTGGSFSVGSNTLTIGDIAGTNSAGLSTTSTSNLRFSSGTAIVSLPGSISQLNNLYINRTFDLNLSSALIINGNLTIQAGSLNIGAFPLTLNNSINIILGTLNASNGLVNYNQSSNGQTVLAINYGSLTFSDFNKTINPGTVGISNVFTPGTATLHTVIGTNFNFTRTTNQTIPAFTYSDLSSTDNPRTLASSGTIRVLTDFNPGTGIYTTTGSTVEFARLGDQIIPVTSGIEYNNLVTSGSGIKTISSSISINGDLTIGSGTTFSTSGAGYSVNIGGNWDNNGSFSGEGSTVTFDGTSTQNITGENIFDNLVVNNPATSAVVVGSTSMDTVIVVQSLQIEAGSGSFTTNNKLLITDGAGIMDLASVATTGGSISGNVRFLRQGYNAATPIRFNQVSTPVDSSSSNVTILQNAGFFGRWYNETNPSVSLDIGWTNATSGLMGIGRGYATRRPNILDFNGPVNNGTITIPITRTTSTTPTPGVEGWNLIGNPYPSAFDKDEFLTANGSLLNPQALYIWNAVSGDHITWNSGVPMQTMPTMQGFWVKKQASGTSNITFNNSMRRTANAALNRISSSGPQRIYLSMTNSNGYSDETLIGFFQDALNGYDSKYDAIKLISAAPVQLSSSLTGESYAIQGLAPLMQATTIPLVYNATVIGSHTITPGSLADFSQIDVILEDSVLNVFHNLKTQGNYIFTQNTVDYGVRRFKLHFYPPTVASTPTQVNLLEAMYMINLKPGVFALILPDQMQSTDLEIELFNVQGIKFKPVVVQEEGRSIIELTTLPKGTYIARCLSNKGMAVYKIIHD